MLKRDYNRNYAKTRIREVQLEIEKDELRVNESLNLRINERKDRLIAELSKKVNARAFVKIFTEENEKGGKKARKSIVIKNRSLLNASQPHSYSRSDRENS